MRKSKWEIYLMIVGGFFVVALLLFSFFSINFLAFNLLAALGFEKDQTDESISFDLKGAEALNLLPNLIEPVAEPTLEILETEL